MKTTSKYIALAALALGFTACSQDEEFMPQQEDIVKIATANIATEVQTRVNTLGEGTSWDNNDKILLVNNSRDNKNSGTYTYDGTNWNLSEGMVLYASSATNDFTAYYPASEAFTLPADQSTEAGIKSADRMIATTTSVAKGAAVALSFERQNAMVTIIPSFNTEFGDDATISTLQIDGITSFHPASATDYKAIIAPRTGFEVTVKVKVGETEQTLTAASTTEIEAGNHYTFDLKVGKDKMEMGTVTVAPWTDNTLEGGVAEELTVESSIGEGTLTMTVYKSATSDEITSAIANAINAGCTTLDISLPADAGEDMVKAITAALAATVDPSLEIPEVSELPGTIDLTVSGVKKVFEYAFGMNLGSNENWRAGALLKTLTLPDVTEIEDYGIYSCPNLTSVSAPKCEVLGAGALAENDALTSVYLPAAKIIGNSTGATGTFFWCENLTEIYLPEATTLGKAAFATCSNLKTVYLPKVTEILGTDAFRSCQNLEAITLGALATVNNGNAGTFGSTPTGNIDLVLSPEQKEMTFDSGTKYWNATETDYNGSDDYNNKSFIGYTFKSVTLQ